jgi:aspartyl-tRNA(Asn)/glutamyl-tRNA(Gln) amidotransferase subunit A
VNGEAIAHLTLVEAADAIARGELSSVDATRACLDRIERFGPSLNCIVSIESEAALEAAQRADAKRTRGAPRRVLYGVPLAHKDLFYRAGKVVACGSKIRRDFVPIVTATALGRLEEAGALNIGALHMAEFAMSPVGYNEHYGQCRNPWNPAHVSGGSSSGSGAAVAGRLIFGSLGSDTGGSIRHPAAMCGVVGLKPTVTRVSRAGVMPLSPSLDCIGPLGRTARDCARLLSVIAGADPADPTASRKPVPDYEGALTGDIRGVRIAVPSGYYEEHVTEEIRELLERSLAVLRDRGASVVAVKVPDILLINQLAHVVTAVEAATIHRRWITSRPQDYGVRVRSRIEPGLFYPATRYVEALSLRADIVREFVDTALAGADMLHLPAIPIPVPTIEETVGDTAEITKMMSVIRHCTRGFNYLGLPVVSVPMGFTKNGLPAAFQLAGRPFAEALLLQAADAYQGITDWHRKAPKLQ